MASNAERAVKEWIAKARKFGKSEDSAYA